MVMINGKDFSADDIKILKEYAEIFKNDPASLTVTSQPLFGPYQGNGGQYGLLSYPGMRPDMFTAIQRPYGLGRIVGVQRSSNANEKIGILTGVTGASGTNPTDYCGDPPVAGQLKRTVQNYIWGKSFWKTRLNVLPEMGETVDYADAATMQRNIVNLQQSQNPFMPDVMARLDLNNPDGLQLANELWNIGVAFERALARVEIRGNQTLAPASTELGFFKEFNGLEQQVITGRRDLDTQQLSPAADSTVISWGAGIEATIGGRTFLQMIVDTVYSKVDLAERVGLGGMQFAFVGSSKLFHAMTYIWACEYWTSRCVGTAGNPSFVDATEIRRLQLDMMRGQYLLVDNVSYPWINSDGIRSTRAAGNIWTDDNLFFIPVSYQGRRMLNIQYKPMDNADIRDFSEFGAAPIVKPINGGMFLVGTRHNGFCAEHLFAAKMRMILDAPFLAFVVNSIQYTYAAEYRDPFPGTTAHFDGGVTLWDGNYTVS